MALTASCDVFLPDQAVTDDQKCHLAANYVINSGHCIPDQLKVDSPPSPTAHKLKRPRRRLGSVLACCMSPHVDAHDQNSSGDRGTLELLPSPVDYCREHGASLAAPASPRKAGLNLRLVPRPSAAISEAEWHDARSSWTGSVVSTSDIPAPAVATLVRELTMAPPPWVPHPPLAFGDASMRFKPVPAVTGFAAYWVRDDKRTTPFPQPIDVMLKASLMARKVHETIPGILIEETGTTLNIVATPAFMPPGIGARGYVESYDKSNTTEPSWMPRRDLRLGRAYGKLYMTEDGCLIARVWQRPALSNRVDVIMEEYMRLEEGGAVIVDQMTCLHVESGRRATQWQVGSRRGVP